MVNYQYLLEGYDEDWSPVLKKHEATYGNIYEGTYTFKLRAQSPEGVWSEISAYTFTILPPWWRTWWMYTVYVLLAIAFIRLIVFWNGRKLKARAKQLTEEVRKATKEIVEQKKVVEEKHKEITDSINYAGRIQRALLASKELLDEQLNDYFILFKSKDVVSGDFYWAAKLNDHHFILVTADSTGHGVPGAIMSILNISCLEKAVEVEKLSAPNEILHHTRTKIIETLKRDGSSDGGKDGMDGSLLSFDFKNNQLFCASAYNPVWIIRAKHTNQNGYELIEIKGDKMPIGKHEKDRRILLAALQHPARHRLPVAAQRAWRRRSRRRRDRSAHQQAGHRLPAQPHAGNPLANIPRPDRRQADQRARQARHGARRQEAARVRALIRLPATNSPGAKRTPVTPFPGKGAGGMAPPAPGPGAPPARG